MIERKRQQAWLEVLGLHPEDRNKDKIRICSKHFINGSQNNR